MFLNKKASAIILVFVLIVAVLLIWGVVGGIASQDVGVTCDMGVGNAFCWRWHTNTIGQVKEFVNNIVTG